MVRLPFSTGRKLDFMKSSHNQEWKNAVGNINVRTVMTDIRLAAVVAGLTACDSKSAAYLDAVPPIKTPLARDLTKDRVSFLPQTAGSPFL
jgi:hypothetical protein